MSNTIDQEELKKFQKNIDEWQDENGEFRILHKINPLRLEYVYNQISNHFSNKSDINDLKIIDVGCGGGIFTNEFASMGFKNINAIDANNENIEAAQIDAKNKNIINNVNYLHKTTEDLLQDKQHHYKKYDVVISFEVIEHVNNPELFISNLINLLNNNGILILSTINQNPKSYFMSIILAEYLFNFTKIGTHQYSKFIKPSCINKILEKNNMKLHDLTGMNYNLNDQSWVLDDDISVNYFLTAV